MDYQLIGVVCAGIAVVTVVLYLGMMFRSMKLLKEIRDRMDHDKNTGGR